MNPTIYRKFDGSGVTVERMVADAAPGASDDVRRGIKPGTEWNVRSGGNYVCIDNPPGAAVWEEVSNPAAVVLKVCMLKRNFDFSVPNTGTIPVPWNVAEHDPDNLHSGSNSYIEVPVIGIW